jgi:hypothetical protein
MMNLLDLTTKSAALYIKMIKEAEYDNYDNVDGFPLALMDFTSEERGNLADLKKKGLVETSTDPDTPRYVWVEFVDEELAYNVQSVLSVLKG